jgi:AraC-like DNA-binding protein
MILSLSILGVILSLLLLVFNVRKFNSSVYLGSFFLLISLYGFIQYALLYSNSVYLIGIVYINIGFPIYLIGPVLYIYIRSVLTDDSKLKIHDLFHLAPMLIYLAGTFPYILTPWPYKLEMARQICENGLQAGWTNLSLTPIYKYIPAPLVYLSRPALILGYLFWSAFLLLRYSQRKDGSAIFMQQRFMQKWLWLFLSFLFILVVSHGLQVIITALSMNPVIFKTLNLFQVISALGISGLMISPFFFPQILYGLPRVPESMTNPDKVISVPDPDPARQKVTNIKFETDYIETISHKTEQCMTDLQPYLQQDFNIAQLSVLVNIPAHHLAWHFRQVKQLSFTEFRNRWRVEHAKKLILDGKSTDLTLEAIGFLSGFSSRNTFLNAFKKVEGISPNAFLSQVKNSKII